MPWTKPTNILAARRSETIDDLTTQEQFDELQNILDVAFLKTYAICVPPDQK